MAETTPDASELRRVLAHIEANLKYWRQEDYRADLGDLVPPDSGEIRCGTAFCFAGWKAQLDGVRWKYTATSTRDRHLIVLPDGSETTADEYAAKAFGIEHTRHRCEIPLFAAENTLDDLRRIIGELCESAEAVADA